MDSDYPVANIYDDILEGDVCTFGTYFPNCGQNLCTHNQVGENFGPVSGDNGGCSKECSSRKTGRLTELNMGSQKQVAILRKLGSIPDKIEEDKEAPPVADCCPHTEKEGFPRTFLLTFNDRGDDDCMLLEKNRCKAFWEFVESEDILQALIKDGEFFYENPPQPITAVPVSGRRRRGTAEKAALSEQQRQFMLRSQRDRLIHDEEERRFLKQRQRNLELQQKSGQYQTVRKDKANADPPRPRKDNYADTCEPSFEEVMNEMKLFDKLTKNPVKLKSRDAN